MNAKPLRFPLLALLTLAPAAAAQTQHAGQDVDVYKPVAQAAGSNGGLRSFDADWTADGRLAMAHVETVGINPTTNAFYDRVVIALREPGNGTRVLATFDTKQWRVDHVSVAVPTEKYGSPDLDRIYVAISAWTGVAGTFGESSAYKGYREEVRAVRLLSVPFDSSGPKLTLALPPNTAKGAPVPYDAAPQDAEVCVHPYQKSYVVDLAFVDPYNPLPAGGHVMVGRSFDGGQSMTDAVYVTGPYSSAAASKTPSPLVNSLFARPALAFDDVKGTTLLAIEDTVAGVVHLLRGHPSDKDLELEFSTPGNDMRVEIAPRVAAQEGRVNVTCLAGQPDKDGARRLTWYTGVLGVPGSFDELSQLLPQALSRGDLEVRGSKGLVAVIGLEDTGAPRAFWIEADRSVKSAPMTVTIVDDDLDQNVAADLATGNACAARTPDHATADRRTPLFMIKDKSGQRTVRMDP